MKGKIIKVFKEFQNISFKRLSIASLILSVATLLWIYSICGTLYKVDCHQVILRGF